jgi:hypothetical protein
LGKVPSPRKVTMFDTLEEVNEKLREINIPEADKETVDYLLKQREKLKGDN